MRRERRTLRGMVVISISSIRIEPALWSISRSSSDKKVLFPLEFNQYHKYNKGCNASMAVHYLPVLPHIAILSPPSIVTLIFSKTFLTPLSASLS